MSPDLKAVVLLTVDEVADLFRHPGNRKWVYDTTDRGFLKPYVRRFGRRLYFDRAGIEKLIAESSH